METTNNQHNDVNFSSTEPWDPQDVILPPVIQECLDRYLKDPNFSQEEQDDRLGLEASEFNVILQEILDERTIQQPSAPPLVTQSTNNTIENQKKEKGVVSTDQNQQSEINDANEFIQTGQMLQLIVQPNAEQRVRREKELLEFLRFICVPQNEGIVLEMPDIRENLGANVTAVLRVSRITLPQGPNGDRLVHPYGLWIKDLTARGHHGSLLLNITDEMMMNRRILIKKLILGFVLQRPLAAMRCYRCHTIERFNCDEWFPTNVTKPKQIIEAFHLNYSILHFQVFLIDGNQNAYATDLICETNQIYTYEGQEIGSISSISSKRKKPKRLGESSKIGKKVSKNKTVVKRKFTSEGSSDPV